MFKTSRAPVLAANKVKSNSFQCRHEACSQGFVRLVEVAGYEAQGVSRCDPATLDRIQVEIWSAGVDLWESGYQTAARRLLESA